MVFSTDNRRMNGKLEAGNRFVYRSRSRRIGRHQSFYLSTPGIGLAEKKAAIKITGALERHGFQVHMPAAEPLWTPPLWQVSIMARILMHHCLINPIFGGDPWNLPKL